MMKLMMMMTATINSSASADEATDHQISIVHTTSRCCSVEIMARKGCE